MSYHKDKIITYVPALLFLSFLGAIYRDVFLNVPDPIVFGLRAINFTLTDSEVYISLATKAKNISGVLDIMGDLQNPVDYITVMPVVLFLVAVKQSSIAVFYLNLFILVFSSHLLFKSLDTVNCRTKWPVLLLVLFNPSSLYFVQSITKEVFCVLGVSFCIYGIANNSRFAIWLGVGITLFYRFFLGIPIFYSLVLMRFSRGVRLFGLIILLLGLPPFFAAKVTSHLGAAFRFSANPEVESLFGFNNMYLSMLLLPFSGVVFFLPRFLVCLVDIKSAVGTLSLDHDLISVYASILLMTCFLVGGCFSRWLFLIATTPSKQVHGQNLQVIKLVSWTEGAFFICGATIALLPFLSMRYTYPLYPLLAVSLALRADQRNLLRGYG